MPEQVTALSRNKRS